MFTFHVTRVGIEPHQLDSFVVASRGDQITCRAPGEAVNRSFMVFGTLEQHRRLTRRMIISIANKRKRKRKEGHETVSKRH